MRPIVHVIYALGLLSGCMQQYAYTPTTRLVGTPRPLGCHFDILATRPDSEFDELGVLEPPGAAPDNVAAFRDKVMPEVCRAGGHAVLAEVNGLGRYVRGIVIRFRDYVEPTSRTGASTVREGEPQSSVDPCIAAADYEARAAKASGKPKELLQGMAIKMRARCGATTSPETSP